MNSKILLIDNDDVICESLSSYMRAVGFEVLRAQNGYRGLNQTVYARPDLVLLDIIMPDVNGWEILKQLREVSTVPIIVLTSKISEADILHGFYLGADDYVKKPFSFAELEARIVAVLSRTGKFSRPASTMISEDLTINFERKHVSVDGKRVELTPTEYRLLEVLARHANRTIPLTKLLAEVWDSNYKGDEQHVKQFIWSLRKKIESDPDEPKHLKTRRGFGYRFE